MESYDIKDELKDKKKIMVATKMESGFDDEEKYNEIGIAILNNGALSIHNASRDSHIYLYPDQVEALKQFLNEKENTKLVCSKCKGTYEVLCYDNGLCDKCNKIKPLANSITCPECKSENCFVWDVDGGVAIECKDCGMKDFQLHEEER